MNYKEIAFDMLFRGNPHHKLWIELYLKACKDEADLMNNIKEYVDREIDSGEFEV